MIYDFFVLEDALESVGEHFGVTIDLHDENVVFYVQKAFDNCIKEELITSIVWIVIGFVFLFVGLCLIKPFWRNLWGSIRGDEDSDDDVTFFYGLFCLGFLAIGIPVFLTQVFDILEVVNFPEKVFLDCIQSYLS